MSQVCRSTCLPVLRIRTARPRRQSARNQGRLGSRRFAEPSCTSSRTQKGEKPAGPRTRGPAQQRDVDRLEQRGGTGFFREILRKLVDQRVDGIAVHRFVEAVRERREESSLDLAEVTGLRRKLRRHLKVSGILRPRMRLGMIFFNVSHLIYNRCCFRKKKGSNAIKGERNESAGN